MDNEIKLAYETEYAYDVLQDFQDYERNRVLARIAPGIITPGSKVLDLACNDGVVADYFVSIGMDAYCLDLSEKALAMAKKRGLTNLYQGSVEGPLPFEDSFFDVIFWGDNVEHLFFPQKALGEIDRVLKDDGILFISAPNMGWIVNRLYALIMGMPRRTEGQRQPPWKWGHIRFFNKRMINKFLNEYNFEMTGFWATDRRKLFEFLARFWPSMMGGTFLLTARKKGSTN